MGNLSSLAYDVNANKIKRIQGGKKQKFNPLQIEEIQMGFIDGLYYDNVAFYYP